MSIDYDGPMPGPIVNGLGWDDGPINELAAALAKAQGEMANAIVNKVNPHFRSRYADLGSVRDATIPALSGNGLAIVQRIKHDQGSFWLLTAMLHSSGQKLTSEYPLPSATDKPQAFGSALTYARRYCWASLCGIASEEDDDANSAEAAAVASNRPAPPKPNVLRPPAAPKPDNSEEAEAYIERWRNTLDAAVPKEFEQIASSWSDEKEMRDRIIWPEDGNARANLQKRVQDALKNLRGEVP